MAKFVYLPSEKAYFETNPSGATDLTHVKLNSGTQLKAVQWDTTEPYEFLY